MFWNCFDRDISPLSDVSGDDQSGKSFDHNVTRPGDHVADDHDNDAIMADYVMEAVPATIHGAIPPTNHNTTIPQSHIANTQQDIAMTNYIMAPISTSTYEAILPPDQGTTNPHVKSMYTWKSTFFSMTSLTCF
jgi:hypothetical protein